MSHVILLYVNDINVKDSKTKYENEEISELSEIQRFMMKHLQNINCVLIDLKYAELILAVSKLMFCFLKMKLIEFIYNENERHSDSKKIAKII